MPEAVRQVSAAALQLAATLLGLAGTALVILQARFWIAPGHANHSVLWLTAFVPLIAFIVFMVVPRRGSEPSLPRYPLGAAAVWVNLGLPVVLTLLCLLLVGISGSFDSFAGFGLLVGVNAGRNLREWLRHGWRD